MLLTSEGSSSVRGLSEVVRLEGFGYCLHLSVAAVVAAMHSHEHPVARRRRADSSSSVSGNQSGSSVAACSPSAAVEGTSLKL